MAIGTGVDRCVCSWDVLTHRTRQGLGERLHGLVVFSLSVGSPVLRPLVVLRPLILLYVLGLVALTHPGWLLSLLKEQEHSKVITGFLMSVVLL